jgi:peroxiredoxin
MRALSIFILILISTVSCLAQNGQRAEKFTAVSIGGKTVELTTLKGKIVLLTFWSSRCAICQNEIPNLNELAAGYAKDKDIVFLAATMEGENIVESFVRNNPFNFTILPDSFGLLLKYADRDAQGRLSMGFPAYYLIDQEGYIQYHDSGWDKVRPLDTAIKRLVSHR